MVLRVLSFWNSSEARASACSGQPVDMTHPRTKPMWAQSCCRMLWPRTVLRVAQVDVMHSVSRDVSYDTPRLGHRRPSQRRRLRGKTMVPAPQGESMIKRLQAIVKEAGFHNLNRHLKTLKRNAVRQWLYRTTCRFKDWTQGRAPFPHAKSCSSLTLTPTRLAKAQCGGAFSRPRLAGQPRQSTWRALRLAGG